ncbi:carbonate dehydratase [Erysipelotrichaceae bacterium]|nr:carbonate dehydratase [Erysipelotrichaceae bacterium]
MLNDEKNGRTDIEYGLTIKEVDQRTRDGLVNIVTESPTKSVKEIIKTNSLTLFNGLNIALAILVVIAGKPENTVFAFVIVANTFIGIFQEVRAKRTLEKLAVLNTVHVEALREGAFVNIEVEAIVLGDIIKFSAGDQISIDGIVRAAEAEIDESLLTGEADAVYKVEGEEVLAGSFVIAGVVLVQVSAVGNDMYASTLAMESKSFTMSNSLLMSSIRKIIKWVTFMIVPVGILLMVTQLFISGNSWQMAVIGAVGGIVGMIPEGIVLLTSIAFMVGVMRLARNKILVQELPAVEILARVDMLCLDKTGTITEGALQVKQIKVLEKSNEKQADLALAALALNLPAANATQIALQQVYQFSDWKPKTIIPFSSTRKWSGITFDGEGTWLLGAPEMLLKDKVEMYGAYIESESKRGCRVLALVYTQSEASREMSLEKISLVAFISFKDIVRKSAKKTLAYFKEEGVDIKIISGDNPITVAAIAKIAGVENSDTYFDARFLPADFDELKKLVEQTSIFGRVSPEQKKRIIKALQQNGHTVAMTGDGVNDVLALKQADCGIAMASGSEATRSVAQLVLLNSDFSALPTAVREGRKVINNISQVASLYLVKTIYSVLLSIYSILLFVPYPFLPVQLTYISTLMVGIPSFFLVLAPNVKPVSGNFLTKVLKDTIPGALTIFLMTVAIHLLQPILGFDMVVQRSLMLILLGGIQFLILIKVTYPFNQLKIMLISITGIIFVLSLFVHDIQDVLMIQTLAPEWYIMLIGLITMSWFIMLYFEKILISFYGLLEKPRSKAKKKKLSRD